MAYDKKPQMILFDVGGTLFRDGKCIFRDGLSALRKAALNPDVTDDDTLLRIWNEYHDEIGWSFRSKSGAVLDMSLSSGIKYTAMCAGLRFNKTIAELEEIFDRFNSTRELMPGVEELLEALYKNGIRTAVISNNAMSGEGLSLALDRWLPGNKLEFSLTSADVLLAKPHKSIFHCACSLAGLEPSECWYCGDSMLPDIVGSGNAGMSPVLIDTKSAISLEYRTDIGRREYMTVNNWKELTEHVKKFAE